MTRFVHRSWWKVLAVLLVLYGLVAGLLVPLKPNLLTVSPRSAKLGETVTLDVVGYNTLFTGEGAGAMNAWLVAGDSTDLSLRAENIVVTNDRQAQITFKLPDFLPDPETEKVTLPIYINSPGDGTFVDPVGLFIRQEASAPDRTSAETPWRSSSIQKGELRATPRTTFPYRGHLAESIRNTYFHVSLWFAMMFVFVAAVTYAIKYLLRSRHASNEGVSVVSFRDKADYWSVAFTSVGMLFGVLGLLTGAVWAKYTWGSYWSWDIKQFTTLIALLIYAGYFVLRASFPDPEQRARLGAAYNIFAFACLIPLIYILPRLSGNSLHPGAAGNPAFGGEDLDNTMRMVFYPIIIGWTLMGFWMAGVSYRARLLKERLLLEE
ncbi:cytochrome c assembly protein [Neolewinella aurantiaca]|uniref:Cytochrome c assembly protein n=2 Tax=Neolewinella aurantiaca TaxID=2602767 RepID=A0A5C7FQ30_9BACT|nr:cytochrome c assembly protein [Neolewinella aurantiaca]